MSKCPICNNISNKIIWNHPIRSGKNKWTKSKIKILRCDICEVGYLKKRNSSLEDNKVFRKIYDGDNSIKKYMSFNKPREIKKLNFIKKFIKLKKMNILESNCGAGAILNELKKTNKITAGVDHEIYRDHLKKNNHLFFESLKSIKSIKFDIILSLAEIEHKYNPILFVKELIKLLKANGKIIFRIPNYNNIYYYFLKSKFQTFDFRTSHNFYFSEKSADFLFQKLKLKILVKTGMQEYSVNHFFQFLKSSKRVENKFKKFINKKNDALIIKNIEEHFLSTSMLYIVQKS